MNYRHLLKLFNSLIALCCFSSPSFADLCDPNPTPNGRFYLDQDYPSKISLRLSKNVHNTGSFKDFLFYSGQGKYDTYFTLNIPFDPINQIYKQLRNVPHYQTLRQRKELEAHITVLTPVEYYCIFGKHNVYGTPAVSMDQIQQAVEKFGSRAKISFDVLSMGSGQSKIESRLEETFFIIVKSQSLIELRSKLRDLLTGPAKDAFGAGGFYPHITVGFTRVDLHESNGVVKDEKHSKDGRFALTVE